MCKALCARLCALGGRVSGEPLQTDSLTPLPTRACTTTWADTTVWKQSKIQLPFGSPLAGKCEPSVFYYSALITSACSLLEAIPFPRNLFCFSSLAVFPWALPPPSPTPALTVSAKPHLLWHGLLPRLGDQLLHDPT